MAEQEAAQKTAEAKTPHVDIPPEWAHVGVVGRIKNWITEEGPWWLCSFVFHLVLVCSLALVSGKVVEKIVDEAPSFEEANIDKQVDVPKEIERFEVGETPEDPTELNTDTLSLEKPAQIAQDEKYYDDSATFHEAGGGMAANTNQPNLGGLGGFDVKGLGSGPAVKGKGGVGVGVGTGTHPGSGGDGWGFGGRGTGSRKAMLGQRRRHPPIGAGRGRRLELVRPAPVARRQLESDRLQGPLQGCQLHRTEARSATAPPPPRPWRCCRSLPPDKRTSRRGPTSRPSMPASPISSRTRRKTAICGWAARCTITAWRRSPCANATE